MKKLKPLIILTLFIAFPIFAQDSPQIGFIELMELSEEDYNMVVEARKLTALQNIPHTVYLEEGVFVEARSVENGRVVYTVIQNILDIYDDGFTAFWNQIDSQYDLSIARQHFANGETINPTVGYPIQYDEGGTNREFAPTFLMIPESTNDRVMSFNVATGDLINADFIPADPANLATPIDAILTPGINVFVSDQIIDHIVVYDTLGTFLGIWIGGIQDTLDNMRGIKIAPDLNSLMVTVASGANSDAIAQFDPSGTYVGNFIEPNATVMDSPWEIVFRTSDVLVSAGTSDNIARYDLSGTYLGNFVTALNFPEQIKELTSGNIIAAGFSTPSGLYIYDSNGAQLNYFDAVTGLRGCYQLISGNYLVTSGTGVHEIDETTGALVRTIIAGVSARFVEPFDVAAVPVELTSFSANVVNGGVVLSWTTATEINNSGFQVERSKDNESFKQITFVPGFGTTTEPKSYSYTDNSVNSGTYYYRLTQIDLNGGYSYSEVLEVNFGLPTEFALEQNYPNPFNPTTTISYSIQELSFVTLKIYDVLGSEVAILVNNKKPAGNYEVEFDATGLPSGTYFYRIQAGNFVETKKMILLK